MPPKSVQRKQRNPRSRAGNSPTTGPSAAAAAAAPAIIAVTEDRLRLFKKRTEREAAAALAGRSPEDASAVLASLAGLVGRPIATYAPAVEGLDVSVLLAAREGAAFVRSLAGAKQQGRMHDLPAVPSDAARALAGLCERVHKAHGGAPLLLVPHVDSSTGGSRTRPWIEREVVPLLQHAGVRVTVVAALALAGAPRGSGVAGLAPFPVSRAAAQTAFMDARDRITVPPGLVPPRAVVVVIDDSLNTGASLLGAVAELRTHTAAASVQGVAIAANDIVRRRHRPVPLHLDGSYVAAANPCDTAAGAALHAAICAGEQPATFELAYDPTGCVARALCESLAASAPGLGAALAACASRGLSRGLCLLEHLRESVGWAEGACEGDTTQTYIRIDTATVREAARAAADVGADEVVAAAINGAVALAKSTGAPDAAVVYGGDTTGRINERNIEHILSQQACDRTSRQLQRFNGGAATIVLNVFLFNEVVGAAAKCGVSFTVAKGVAECIAWRLIDRAGCTNKAATGYTWSQHGLSDAIAGPVAVLSKQLQVLWPGMTRDASRALVKAHVSLAALLKDSPDVAVLAAQRVAAGASVGVGWSTLCAQGGALGAAKAWVRFVDGAIVLCCKSDDGAMKISSPEVQKLKGLEGAPMAWVRRGDDDILELCDASADGATKISSPEVHWLKGIKSVFMAWARVVGGVLELCSEVDDGASKISSPDVPALKGCRAWVRCGDDGVLELCDASADGATLISSPEMPSLKGTKGTRTRWVLVDALGNPTRIATDGAPGAVLVTRDNIPGLRNLSGSASCDNGTVPCHACKGPAIVALKSGHGTFEAWHSCEGSSAQVRTGIPQSSAAAERCRAIAEAAGQVVDCWDDGAKAAVDALNSTGCLGHIPCKTCKMSLPIRLKARDESFSAIHACPKAGYRQKGHTNKHVDIVTSISKRSPQYKILKATARARGVDLARWADAAGRQQAAVGGAAASAAAAPARQWGVVSAAAAAAGSGSASSRVFASALSAGRGGAFYAQGSSSHLLSAAVPSGQGPGVAVDDDDEATQSEHHSGDEAETRVLAVAAGIAAPHRRAATSPTFDSSCPVSYDVDFSVLCPWPASQLAPGSSSSSCSSASAVVAVGASQSSRALLGCGGPPAPAPWHAELCAARASCLCWVDEGGPVSAARAMPAAAAPSGSGARTGLPSAARAGLCSSSSPSSSAAGPWRGSYGLPAQPLASLVAASAVAAAAASCGILRSPPSVSAPGDLTTSVGSLKRKRAGEVEGAGEGDVIRVAPALVALRGGSTAARDTDADTVALFGSSDDVMSSGGAVGAEAAGAAAVVVAPLASASAHADDAPQGAGCPPTSLVVSSPWHASGSP